MLQLLVHIRPSSFSLTGNEYSSDCCLVYNNTEESQPVSVVVYTDELFSHEEMMGIKGNTQSIQNWN